ncbi:LuxR C-terminal-related transcriptional regulator [Atopobiaceae bacterium 24-176]
MGADGRALEWVVLVALVLLMTSARWVPPEDWVIVDAALWPPVPCVLVQCLLAVLFCLRGLDARSFILSSIAGIVSGSVIAADIPPAVVHLSSIGSIAVFSYALAEGRIGAPVVTGAEEKGLVSSVPKGRLSPREEQVADLVAIGETPAAVAGALGIREGTVRVVLSHVYEKLNLDGIWSLRTLYGPVDASASGSSVGTSCRRQSLCFGVAGGCCLAAGATAHMGFSLEVPLFAASVILLIGFISRYGVIVPNILEDPYGLAALIVGLLVGWVTTASFARACEVAGLADQVPLDLTLSLLARLLAFAFPVAVAFLPAAVRRCSPAPMEEGQEERMGHYLRYRGCSALEAEVLLAIAAGKTGAQIAESIHYSLGTVNRLRRCGYARMGVHSVAELRKLVADALASDARPPLS